jgi:DNA polymerase-3 subunit delta'
MSLKNIFCQERAISILQRAYRSGRSAHAYIFAGPEGVGKSKTAYAWAKLLLCHEPADGDGFADSCGRCESCRLFDAGSHPDFIAVYKELAEFTEKGKGKKTPVALPIDVIRQFLIAKAPQRPTLSQRKAFVVVEAEKLNIASQNALLKVLEEPPDYCSIILLCTRTERLLPTTKSRCQIIQFGPIAEELIFERLKDMHLEQDPARFFARLARGSIGQACEWARLELAGVGLYEVKKGLVKSLSESQYGDSLELAQWCLAKVKEISSAWNKLSPDLSTSDINRRSAKTLVHIIASALSDAMRYQFTPAEQLINADQRPQIEIMVERFTPAAAAEKISDCYRSLTWIDASVNEKLIFEQMLLNLADSAKMQV